MNTLVNISQGRRFAQAALNLCGSLEQRRDLGTCPTFISSNAEIAACRTSTRRTKQHERVPASQDCDYRVARGGTMTITEIYLFAWAVLGIIVVAILLRFPERKG
jgi:hypothetical protein